jgi:hypothetical protein
VPAWTLHATYEPFINATVFNQAALEPHLTLLRQALSERYPWVQVTGQPHQIGVDFDLIADSQRRARVHATSMLRDVMDAAGLKQFQLYDLWALPRSH